MNIDLAKNYLIKSKKRLKALYVCFIPTEEYSKEDAVRALKDAEFVASIAEIIIK